MTLRRQATVLPFRRFGRRPLRALALETTPAPLPTMSDESRLFALTFAGGFLFMTVYLA